ncbi:phosphotransferase [Microbacterium sp. zg-Y818]|uniref:phosphotransferase n=1 Tax=unclassified Microbacterium TaxID=2609290 RepID=UPI00214B2AC5|nr:MULTISPECIES: phosphotransferase [unclassified Microbacterium]MCR2799437.1 phosphotransferase [Microbacterium sp. zg.Y818]WIM23925.1 phosphotransferase [Microbacterium sp. zg-Y818]
MEEQALAGGNASGAEVVRVGDTVRKPWTASTPSVVRYVETLRAAGIDAPAPLGRDDQGRQVQEFIPGTLAIDAGRFSPADLHRVGSIVRGIHDASATYIAEPDAIWETAIPAPGDELICHNDLAPWNLLIGERWVFIDWDAAAPSTRLWDLAYAAQSFTLSDTTRPPDESAQDLAAFVDGYGADPRMRSDLPAAMIRRTEAMYDLLRSSHHDGTEPWASMFTAGHGEHWHAVSRYVQAHEGVWRAAL